MVVTKREFEDAIKQINKAFAASDKKIEALEAKIVELTPKPAPKKVVKSA